MCKEFRERADFEEGGVVAGCEWGEIKEDDEAG
jgi:hypothetical protein